MTCPACRHETHLRDMGYVTINGKLRHYLICTGCDAWIEEITVLRTLPVADQRYIKAHQPSRRK